MGNPMEKTVVVDWPVVLRLHKLAATGRQAAAEDWEELRQTMAAEQPAFMDWLQTAAGGLSERNRNVCLLVRLGFEPFELANLLGVRPTNLCNIRHRLYKQLFGIDGPVKKFDRRLAELRSPFLVSMDSRQYHRR